MILKKANVNDALNNPLCCKDVVGSEGLYKVAYNGMVYSYLSNKFLKPGLTKATGYLSVSIGQGKNQGTQYIHRIVGLAFIPTVTGKTKINHIDGNKLNNHFYNLEWCTSAENNKHAVDIGLRKVKCTPEMITSVLKEHIRADKNFGAKALSIKYGVHKCTIHEILDTYKYKN